MAVLEILVYPDRRLKQESKPVEVFNDSLSLFVADLEERGYLTTLTTAKVLSARKGRFAFYDGHDILSQGADPTGRKGERCPFETRNIEGFIRLALIT